MSRDHILSTMHEGKLHFFIIMEDSYIISENIQVADTFTGIEPAYETIRQIKAGMWQVFFKGINVVEQVKDLISIIPPDQYERMKSVSSVLDE